MCPTSKPTTPVQPVYVLPAVASPQSSLSLPAPLQAPQQAHGSNILNLLQGLMSSLAPPPAPLPTTPTSVLQDLKIALLQPGLSVSIATPVRTRAPATTTAPASVISETMEPYAPANEEMRVPNLVTPPKRPSVVRKIIQETLRDAEGTADSSSDSPSESGVESPGDAGDEDMSIASPPISPPRPPTRRTAGPAGMPSSETLTARRTVRRKG